MVCHRDGWDAESATGLWVDATPEPSSRSSALDGAGSLCPGFEAVVKRVSSVSTAYSRRSCCGQAMTASSTSSVVAVNPMAESTLDVCSIVIFESNAASLADSADKISR